MFDLIATRTFGLMTARDVRVLWQDGKLYVCKSATDISVFTADKPTKRSGMWTTDVGGTTIKFQPATCGSCRQRVRSSAVGKMTPEEIITSQSVDA